MSAYDDSLKSRVCPLNRLAMSREMSHNYKLLYKVNIDKFSKYKQSYENLSKDSSYLTVNKEVFMEKNQVIRVIKVSWVTSAGQTWAFPLDLDAGPSSARWDAGANWNMWSGQYAMQVVS